MTVSEENYLAVKAELNACRQALLRERRRGVEVRARAEQHAVSGLPGRHAFERALKRSLAIATRRSEALAVWMLDLDGFKRLNDTYGHDAGDHALRLVADRLRRRVRGEDFLAHIGGDEFALIQMGTKEPESVEVMRTRLTDALRLPFTTIAKGVEIRLGVSLGCARFPQNGAEQRALLRVADQNMYRDKQNKKAR